MTKEQQKIHFSSESQDWETPQHIFDSLNDEFGFTVDAAASSENAKCETFWSEETDGLSMDWSNHIVWVNPPYNQAKLWLKKAWEESRKGSTVVCLVPARTDTNWWHMYAMKAEIRFLKGRIKFKKLGKSNSAPFPSAIIVFRPPEFKLTTTELRIPINATGASGSPNTPAD